MPQSEPLTATGTFSTDQASKYLQQMCKHFAHKCDVTYNMTEGDAALPPGPAKLVAGDKGLRVTVTAQDSEGLNLAKYIIDNHLARFAFREDFEHMEWM